MAEIKEIEDIAKKISRKDVSEKPWIRSGCNQRRLFLVVLSLGLVMAVVCYVTSLVPLTSLAGK